MGIVPAITRHLSHSSDTPSAEYTARRYICHFILHLARPTAASSSSHAAQTPSTVTPCSLDSIASPANKQDPKSHAVPWVPLDRDLLQARTASRQSRADISSARPTNPLTASVCRGCAAKRTADQSAVSLLSVSLQILIGQ